jgi:hypothetical protein
MISSDVERLDLDAMHAFVSGTPTARIAAEAAPAGSQAA